MRYELSAVAEAIGQSASRLAERPLSTRLAHVGARYERKLMIVGQAVRGWGGRGWTPRSLQELQSRNEFVEAALEDALQRPEYGCKLEWVVDCWGTGSPTTNTKRSFFWRTAKELMTILEPEAARDRYWASHLVWSNLYKIAPQDEGNPAPRLQKLQRSFCRDLLMKEIAIYRPRYLVFLTGAMMWDFIDLPCFVREFGASHPEHVHARGRLQVDGEIVGSYVVSEHPRGKGVDDLARAIARSMRSAASAGTSEPLA